MKNVVMIVFAGLLMTSCATSQMKKSPKVELEPTPAYSEETDSELYYDLWIEAERDLELCIEKCDEIR